TAPPDLEGELWGRWREPERTGFRAQVRATNFAFRGEACADLSGSVQYTNRVVQFTNVHARRAEGELTVESGAFEVEGQRLHLTNGFSTAAPRAVTRVIGPKTYAAIAPFEFLNPPFVRVEGVIPVKEIKNVDLRFSVEGGPFHWMRFNLPQVRGDLH